MEISNMFAGNFWVALPIALSLTRTVTSQDVLLSRNGAAAEIPNWHIASTADLDTEDIAALSSPGVDTSSWHEIPVPKCTLMGCLIAAGVYDDDELWYSNNLESFDWSQFTVPWVYRHEFDLPVGDGYDDEDVDAHFILQTHGITSRGDIYLNGELVADKEFQSGSYSGHEYDVSGLVEGTNALVIRVYPTDYYKDLALGFIDWNPAPPDNGTGIWRPVNLKQTGSVSLGALSAIVSDDPGSVSLRARVQNLSGKEVTVSAEATIQDPDSGADEIILDQTLALAAGEIRVVEFNHTFDDPQIWWPKQWGRQPLYNARVTVASDNTTLSDVAEKKFGLRSVSSVVNEDDDIVFSVNGHEFQVMGGGYSADMFLRFDPERFEIMARYMLDMGLNTIRLEGNDEQTELYEIADRLGLMVMAGWECCNKWESWTYNRELAIGTPHYWTESDYADANATMHHEAAMLQTHPSLLAFLIGSDFWPDDTATEIYVSALRASDWQVPVVGAASKRGYPDLLGRSGMKMAGPYDWVPPNYWYDLAPSSGPADESTRYGAAFGFGSELGAGVGTPELGSLRKFLTEADREDLWTAPEKGLYHMSTNVSQFYDRGIYNEGLWARYGAPASLGDYLRKAQVMDYEAIRAEHEGFAARWTMDGETGTGTGGRRATGMIYWMLVNAWPSLHWNQFDYYLHPAGTYFGSKVGSRLEHVSYDYVGRDVWLINRSLDQSGGRTVVVEVIGLDGEQIASETFEVDTEPNTSRRVGDVPGLDGVEDVVFVRLRLLGEEKEEGEDTEGSGGSETEAKALSRNVYWVAPTVDELDWDETTWYYTPVTEFADYTSLFDMESASVAVTSEPLTEGGQQFTITLENESDVPAFFIRLNAVDGDGEDVNPVTWSDNYVTLWPRETMKLEVDGWEQDVVAVEMDGANVAKTTIGL